jgi:hypothetical protein
LHRDPLARLKKLYNSSHTHAVDGLFLFYVRFPYQAYGGIRRNGVNKMGFDPRSRWIYLSSGSTMPSLPPRDGGASSTGAGIRAIGPAITAIGMLHSTDGTSEIVVSLDDVIDATVNNVVALLPPSATSRGEHDAFGFSSDAVGLPALP